MLQLFSVRMHIAQVSGWQDIRADSRPNSGLAKRSDIWSDIRPNSRLAKRSDIRPNIHLGLFEQGPETV